MKTIIDVFDIKSTKDGFAFCGEEREVPETPEEAVTEAFKAMLGGEEKIDAAAFISALEKLGYLVMSEVAYENAADEHELGDWY